MKTPFSTLKDAHWRALCARADLLAMAPALQLDTPELRPDTPPPSLGALVRGAPTKTLVWSPASPKLAEHGVFLASIDWRARCAACGIMTKGEHRAESLLRPLMTSIIQVAFDHLGLRRLWLRVDLDSPDLDALEAMGFVHEGTLRRYFNKDGRPRDAALMGLLAGEQKLGEIA